MEKIAVLRKQAREMGIPKGLILAASPEDLSELIQNFSGGNGNQTTTARPRKKSAGKVAPRKKASTRSSAPRSKAASSTSVPAKSTRGRQAKRPTTAEPTGRFTLSGVDYGTEMYEQGDGWNARPGSIPDKIIKALKKARGNRDKVVAELTPKVDEFVTPKKRNGQRRNKAEKLAMLKYRISRTAWEFAMRTGQHTASSDRVQYGTGGTGEGIWKPKAKRAATKTASKPAPRKSAAKPAAKRTATKAASKAAPRKPQARKPAARKPQARGRRAPRVKK